MRKITRGLLVVFLASLGYGALPIFAKLALAAGVEVLPLLAWRFLLGSGLLWIFVVATGRPRPPRGRRTGLVLLGLLYALNSVCYMLGLDRLPASVATLVLFSYPAMTVLLARFWVGERLTPRRIAALALTTAGCALTVGTGLGGGMRWAWDSSCSRSCSWPCGSCGATASSPVCRPSPPRPRP
ncbi:MAG: DMT family transporter [Gemmatimonadetes bacterium]|nr:DMT family transporter [Gemmatimonadota bacterium]